MTRRWLHHQQQGHIPSRNFAQAIRESKTSMHLDGKSPVKSLYAVILDTLHSQLKAAPVAKQHFAKQIQSGNNRSSMDSLLSISRRLNSTKRSCSALSR